MISILVMLGLPILAGLGIDTWAARMAWTQVGERRIWILIMGVALSVVCLVYFIEIRHRRGVLQQWCADQGLTYVSSQNLHGKAMWLVLWKTQFALTVAERQEPLLVIHGDLLWGHLSNHVEPLP
ncbi:MAG: hypothetical protein AAB263_07155 [Planctomycetota bacterium]